MNRGTNGPRRGGGDGSRPDHRQNERRRGGGGGGDSSRGRGNSNARSNRGIRQQQSEGRMDHTQENNERDGWMGWRVSGSHEQRGTSDRRGGRQGRENNHASGFLRGEISENDDQNDQQNHFQRNNHHNKKERNFLGPVFGFKKLHNFLGMNRDEVVLSINKDKDHWVEFLDSNGFKSEMLALTLEVIGEKICADVPVLKQQQINVVTEVCTSKKFLARIMEAVATVNTGFATASGSRGRNYQSEFQVDCSPIKIMRNLYQICEFVVKTTPHLAVDNLSSLITVSLGGLCLLSDSASTELMEKFKNLLEQLQDFQQKKKEAEETSKRRKLYGFNERDLAEFDQEEPPDDFRSMQTIPTIEELRQDREIFLRPNKKTGAYTDYHHYLDVQFRLLREDFVRPLKKGVQKFLENQQNYIRKGRMPLGEVRLYTDVRIVQVVKDRDSIVYKIQLSERSYKQTKWDKSKRLLTGSLVVFTTKDNCFQNAYFGVVFSRDLKELRKGILTLTWEGVPPPFADGEEYLMLESEVYLEAYRHTLEALKAIELDKYSMKKFIVDACNSVEAPKYLKEASSQLKVRLASGEQRYVAPLRDDQWPSAEEFGLDDNQYRAFKTAITNEFTIIQGPPGTGKTFLGLKVAQLLLENAELWNGSNDGLEANPITVVCYTNHALDQFLEGILKFYESQEMSPEIIRIGGRCKSQALAEFSLREVRNRSRRKLPKHYWPMEYDARDKVNELEAQRAKGMSEVTGLLHLEGIIDFEKLSKWSQIEKLYPKLLWDCLQDLKWFGIDKSSLGHIKCFKKEQVDKRVREKFNVRNFPINQKTNPCQLQQQVTFQRNAPTAEKDDEDDFDDEDYDLDELMGHRLVDDILLESETSKKAQTCQKCVSYLPNCSVRGCEKSLEQMDQEIESTGKPMTTQQALFHFAAKESEKIELLNRHKLLKEIFRLYKENLIELPDVSQLLEDIKTGRTIDYYDLPPHRRWALYFEVVKQIRVFLALELAEIEKNLSIAQKAKRDIMLYGDGLVLKDCKVVGLTTTGAAKYNNLLKMIGSKIVIVEEAAEVFEAHIVTCVTEKCEQLILIGDHRQLRPSPTVYDLATKYNLDLSLFERMINNNLHCYPLKMQHRMRPEIADLVVGSIYEELLNHDSVKLYSDIKGVTKNVYFITHTEEEASDKDSCSKSNIHEAKFLAGLCRYLILQEYKPEQITVLTMYTGQMFLLKKEISKTCEGVRITCVDNFQGEENDIILLSLVRSNENGSIGFLNIDNRICVSLSRAKQGLYVIGNLTPMAKRSKTWKIITSKLEKQESCGNALELQCQIHGIRTKVQTEKDFSQVPEGGCNKLCETQLPCTHKCQRVCHVVDRQHEAYNCRLPCLKFCDNLPSPHPCKGKCFEPCPPCSIKIEKMLNCELRHKRMLPCHKKVEEIVCSEPVAKTLPCNHTEVLACHIRVDEYKCKVTVRKQLMCGHSREMLCHIDPLTIRCKEMTMKTLSCQHSDIIECWVDPSSAKCQTMVSKTFPNCGHKVNVKCSEVNKPKPCRSKCTTRLECGHSCVKICHVDENPEHFGYECKKDCTKECEYGHKCGTKHPCFKPCPPCQVEVNRTLPNCGHQKLLQCHVNFNQYECLDECQRIIPDPHCLHKCQNLCYQPCGPCMVPVAKRAPCGHGLEVPCSLPARKEDCVKLVSPQSTPACGHNDGPVPCKHADMPSEEVVKYCRKSCGYEFKSTAGGCGHTCLGDCSSCFHGRIHVKCKEQCGKPLVCGHVCEVPCSKVCPPCKKPCFMKCEHSECKRMCGVPCSNCKEKCSWNCSHSQCTKLCGEMCDRKPCNEPCPKQLDCGHDCVGFCGEPCPPLCRVCTEDELTEIFFGTEDDEDARFVYLEDCGHSIESKGLENWLNCDQGSQICAKTCPKCKTTIRNCRRFANLIRQHYKDILTVKMKSFGNKANSDRMRDKWIGEINKDVVMERIFPLIHDRIRSFLVNTTPGQSGGIRMVPKTIDEFSMKSIDFIADSTKRAAHDLLEHIQNKIVVSPYYDKIVAVYRTTLSFMVERHPLSRQEIRDFNKELDRLDYYKQLMIRRCLPTCNPTNHRAYPVYAEAEKLIESNLVFTSERKEYFKMTLQKLDDLLKSGLGISDRERKEILNAMGMKQGHWYKCPNGHIYLITECGGAMEESRCNECGAAIGGGSHRLRSDNQVASEMDGAMRSAWPGN